jgi:hypothetical protein
LLLTTLVMDERLELLDDLPELELVLILLLLEQLGLGRLKALLPFSFSLLFELLLVEFLSVLPLLSTPLCLPFCAVPPPTLIQPSNSKVGVIALNSVQLQT